MLGEPSSGQTQEQVLETKKEPKPACEVCGGPSGKEAFGAIACLQCKGFYRRSIWNKKKYSCTKDKKCVIDSVKRPMMCRACRFQKCEAVGMDRYYVKPRPGNRYVEPKEHDEQELEMLDMNDDFRETSLEDFPEAFTPPKVADSDQSQNLPNLETPQCIPSFFRTFF